MVLGDQFEQFIAALPFPDMDRGGLAGQGQGDVGVFGHHLLGMLAGLLAHQVDDLVRDGRALVVLPDADAPLVDDPEQLVIAGNHRDAWNHGAIDPNSGTIAMLEMARVIGQQVQAGWRPRRTLMLCSWDGEEDGLLELSKEKADLMKAWDEISKAVERDETVRGAIISRVKGGLAVDARAATLIERQAVRWAAEFVGYPADAAGAFTSGGTVSNTTALAAARERAIPGARRDGLGSTAAAVLHRLRAHVFRQVFGIGRVQPGLPTANGC